MKTNLAQNQRTPPNPSDTKKEESWLSKNAQLLVNISLGAVAIAVIYKLGQSTANFDPKKHVSTKFGEASFNLVLDTEKRSEDFMTLFNFCVNNKKNATPSLEGCSEDAFKATSYVLSDDNVVYQGSSKYFPDLAYKNGQWVKRS